MRIVNFHEFCGLPDGTVFSYWEPCIVSGLYRRGSVILGVDGLPIDFFEATLGAASYNGEFPVCELVESRWGMFDHDQLFLVYEPQDIAVIADGLGIERQ